MNVHELIELLSDMPEDAEVRLAIQPSWPFQHDIAQVVSTDGIGAFCTDCEVDWEAHDEHGCDASTPDPDDEPDVVYIAEAGQHYDAPYLPGHVAQELGWR